MILNFCFHVRQFLQRKPVLQTVENISNASVSISDNDVAWRVNTNSDKFLQDDFTIQITVFLFNSNGYWFNNQWLLNDFATNVPDENGYSMLVQQIATSADEQIALASNKNTEIFRIAPTNVPYELDLNMFLAKQICHTSKHKITECVPVIIPQHFFTSKNFS